MDTKNTKTKTSAKSATKTTTAKQSGGNTENVVVQNANDIVENKLQNKVVELDKKAPKKSAKKETVDEKQSAQPTQEKQVDEKQAGGAKNKSSKKAKSVEAAPPVAETKETGAQSKKSKAVTKVAAKEVPETKETKPKKNKTTKKETKVEVKQETEGAADDAEEKNSKLRYFKLIYNNEIQGRYCGKKPKQAANKAFSSIIKDCKKTGQQHGGVNVDINFTIKECTRNSKHKEYRYVGKRQILDNPVKVEIENADGTIKQIEYKYHNKLQKAPKNA